MEVRGFHVKNAEAKARLERIGEIFLRGYACAMEAASAGETEEMLEEIPRDVRGFAYEGAGMGAVVHDALPGHSGRLAGLLAGRGRHHDYMIYVGIGWAMARLPKPLWPDITATDPLLRWLALDGYGFHQAYFKTGSYVRTPEVRHPFRWAGGHNHYTANAIDQGIGRALWFVGGTDPEVVAGLIRAYPEHRHGDLYAGAGLACTYAGGADEDELRGFAEGAGEHRWALAQGSAFAVEARVKADTVIEHTHLAARVVCGTTAERAARVCRDLRPPAADPRAASPAYETWRRGIAAELASLSLLRKGADQ
ncbi:enediyne biosynthesis protein [Streptomyces griseoflavus]|nr:enediyne biosynthesis protein [Streptomyces griseoflavus]